MIEFLSLDAPWRFWSRSGGEDGPALYEFLNVEAPAARPEVTSLRQGLVELLDGLSADEQLIVAAWSGLACKLQLSSGSCALLVILLGDLHHNGILMPCSRCRFICRSRFLARITKSA